MAKLRLSALSLAALILQTVAPVALAAGGCSVSALDTVAGLGTEVSVRGCAPGASLVLTMRQAITQEYTQTISTDSNGDATTLIPSKYTVTAGKYEVTVAGETATFTVLADRADDAHSSLLISTSTLRADGLDTATVTVVLRDRYDNPVALRPLALIASRLSDEVTTQSKQTDDEGRFLWTVRSSAPGTMTLIPYDILSGRQLKMRADITVEQKPGNDTPYRASLTGLESGGDVNADLSSALVDHFEIGLPQGATDVKANELFSLTVRALRGSELVRAYVGTLIVKSSDPDADLPKKGEDPKSPSTGRIEIRGVDQGERKVPLAFVLRRKGGQTIEVYDKEVPSLTGKITITVQRDDVSGTDQIVILDPKDRSRVKGETIRLQGKAPSLINLKVKGGKDVVDGESDQEGVFRINVPLNPEDKEVTLFVTSENGTYESAPVHIIIDNEPPKIDSITLNPLEGKTGDPATITVKSEADLASVEATFEGAKISLTGSGSAYVGTLKAPDREGAYDITVVATDGVGNVSSMLTKWQVLPKLLPIVQGVSAESLPGKVLLRWKSIGGVPVAEYKIYIALDSDPRNTLYSISTKKPVTSAEIKDLPLGKTYVFSLTALTGDGEESPEKSQPVTASPLGLVLTAKPGTDSVLLEWTKVPSLPMDRYILRFGVETNTYTETRTVNGEALSFIAHDLLGNTTYEFKLTPVTVTGKTMDELAATVRTTVGGGAFTPGPEDPVPPDIIGHGGAPFTREPPMPPPPTTPASGVPSAMVWILLTITGAFALLHWRRSRLERRLTQEFLTMMSKRYQS